MCGKLGGHCLEGEDIGDQRLNVDLAAAHQCQCVGKHAHSGRRARRASLTWAAETLGNRFERNAHIDHCATGAGSSKTPAAAFVTTAFKDNIHTPAAG